MSVLSGMHAMSAAVAADPVMLDAELDKPRKCYELRLKGVPVVNIAKSFGVDESTIYRWLKAYREAFTREFTDRPRSDLLVDMLAFMRVVRDTAMKEAHQIDLDGMKVAADGTVTASGQIDRNAKHKMLSLAMSAESHSFDMLAKTGVLPSIAKEIHVSFAETKPDSGPAENATPVTREELMNRLIELAGNRRELPPLDTSEEDAHVEQLNRTASGAGLDEREDTEAESEATGNP